MKNLILLVLLTISFNSVFGQPTPWISAEIKINSILYPLGPPIQTFNYGTSILLSENFGRSRITFGSSFSTFNNSSDFQPSDSLNHLIGRKFNTVYLNFPLLYAYTFPLSNKIDMSVFGGVSFSIPQKSIAVSYYNNKVPQEDDLLKQGTSSKRLNIKTGLNIYYHLSKRINAVGNFFTELNVAGNDDSPYITAPNSSAFGFGIGIEYNWR